MASKNGGIKIIARNRKAGYDYHLEQTYEAGLVLTGSEIKSIRNNQINLRDGYVEPRDGELWLVGVHITPYEQSGIYGYSEPTRPRKLLLHKREIAQITERMRERGYTCIPTMVYLKNGLAKVEIALAKGKKLYDKRAAIAKRDAEREIRQALKNRYD
ncbi:MAG: SsrA-binding protein SmpB [Chloroflexota bacterium]|nr:MAG: SsrA-binding protein [Chloroflexota bacterium]